MEFEVEMLVNQKVKDAWGNEAVLKYTRLQYQLKLRRFINQSGLDDIEVIHEKLINLKKDNEDRWIKIIPKDKIELWRPKVDGNRGGKPYLDTKQVQDIDTVVIHQDGSKGTFRQIPIKNAKKSDATAIRSVTSRPDSKLGKHSINKPR